MSSSGVGKSRSSSHSSSSNHGASSSGVGNSRSSNSNSHGASSSGEGNSRSSSHNSSNSSHGTSSSGVGNSLSSSRLESGSGEGNSRTRSRAATNAEKRAATQLSREVADGSMQAGGNAISAIDLMDDDGPSCALEAFKALHHPERKAAEKLLLTDWLRMAEQWKMRQYGHLVNESVGLMAVPLSAFGSTGTVPRVAKLLNGTAKGQKQDEVWDNQFKT